MIAFIQPHQSERPGREPAKAAVPGLVGGIAGTVALTGVMLLVERAFGGRASPARVRPDRTHAQDHTSGTPVAAHHAPDDADAPATVKLASLAARRAAHRDLTRGEKRIAGPALHFTFGAAAGVLYAVLAEFSPRITLGRGTAFGAAVWLGIDQAVMPALKLSKPATRTPRRGPLGSLAAHLAFGWLLETVRGTMRRAR